MSETPAEPPAGGAAGAVGTSTSEARRPKVAIRTTWIWGIFAAELLWLLLLQLPGVADFQKFAFYDEGAWLHLDRLYAEGARPTIDIGYSYGMLPLILGRAWFWMFGRTPGAFIGFVTACNLLAALGVARILKSVGATWPRVLLACVFLPYAIMPGNYSLMHPLEMMLIVFALSAQTRGRYGGALAWATLAVFTKPTMAYVLGLLLLAFAGWLRKSWRVVILPGIVGIAVVVLELCTMGLRPLVNNLLPLTGGRSYRQMDFGFFRAGRDFWLHDAGSIRETVEYYLFTPVTFWLLGTAVLIVWGISALRRLIRNPGSDSPRAALLVTLATLHLVFILALYAWSGSWTYYSYLIVLGLLAGLASLKHGRALSWVLAIVAVFGLTARISDGLNRWQGMVRLQRPAAGLWTYEDYYAEAVEAGTRAGGPDKGHGYFLINGDLPAFWPEARVPRCWFLSPGIQTDAELRRIKTDIAASDAIVLCKDYDPHQEAWNWPEFAAEREQFTLLWEGKHFKVLRRVRPGAPG